MKKRLLSLLLCIGVLFSLCACSLTEDGVRVKVNFVAEGEKTTVSTPLGSAVSPPLTPRVEGKLFNGWFVDEECTEEYDFSTPVYRELTLYADFVLDGAALTNAITSRVMPSIVTVSNRYVSEGREWEAQGSGFIYKIEGGIAYLLTNCHVVYAPTHVQSIRVTDFRGEEYEARIYRRDPFSDPAIDPSYDLAIVSFAYTGDTLAALPFAEEGVTEGDEVISLGAPQNQSHAITFGEMLGLRIANLPDSDVRESAVSAPVIFHSALIASGSSGGPLLNGDLALVGVNYAGLAPEEGETLGSGCAVPLNMVLEFLSIYS